MPEEMPPPPAEEGAAPARLSKMDARIPDWDRDSLHERDCPFCASPGAPAFVRPDDLTVNHCRRCGAWFVSPAPSEGQLASFYESYSSRHQRLPDLSDSGLAFEILRSDPRENLIVRQLDSMRKMEGERCLDVGFGRGWYLHWVKSLGGIPFGVEADRDAVFFVKAHLGIPDVSQGTIFDIGDETYDVIFMVDFVEHPTGILGLLEKAASLLSPGGALVVSTPNASPAAHEPEPLLFRVDLEHMQYLTADTCLYLAGELGLSIAHLESYGRPSLEGIDEPPGPPMVDREPSLGERMGRYVKGLPLYPLLRRFRRSLEGDPLEDLRSGSYHLLCVFEKSR